MLYFKLQLTFNFFQITAAMTVTIFAALMATTMFSIELTAAIVSSSYYTYNHYWSQAQVQKKAITLTIKIKVTNSFLPETK